MFMLALTAALLFLFMVGLTIIRLLEKDITSPNAEILADMLKALGDDSSKEVPHPKNTPPDSKPSHA